MLPSEKLGHVLDRAKQMRANKAPYLDIWQLLGDYIHMRRQDFTSERQAGDFIAREIFDSSAPKAAKTAASSLLSMLWPQSVKRFRFKPPASLPDTREIKTYYETITAKQIAVMDNPKAGLPMALDEYMLDEVSFGTCGVQALKSAGTKVAYKAWGVKHMSVAEDQNGFVDTTYIELMLPVHVIVKEYGIEKVAPRVKDLFDKRQFDKEFCVLIAIEPRITDDFKTGNGNDNMPFQALHIDKENKTLMREGGYDEMPIKVARFWKVLGEVYGRSPGMDALPGVLEANTVWEAVTVAIEKSLDPPLGVLDDGKLGGGEIDTSSGAVNVFNITGRAGDKNPVFPLFTVGEIKSSISLLEQLGKDIADHFFIDRLLDFNNETRMTLGEANIRNRLRNSTLGSIFTRQIAEMFSPLIERTFNILLESGEFGVVRGSADYRIATEINGEDPIIIPEAVAKLMAEGADVYQIEYFTPALRVMQAEEMDGIVRTVEAVGVMRQAGLVGAEDNIDGDVAIRRVSDIAGAPSEILRSAKDVEEIRTERDRVAQEQAKMEMMLRATEGMRNAGQSGLVPVQPEKKAAA